jgi:hypothetical protein
LPGQQGVLAGLCLLGGRRQAPGGSHLAQGARGRRVDGAPCCLAARRCLGEAVPAGGRRRWGGAFAADRGKRTPPPTALSASAWLPPAQSSTRQAAVQAIARALILLRAPDRGRAFDHGQGAAASSNALPASHQRHCRCRFPLLAGWRVPRTVIRGNRFAAGGANGSSQARISGMTVRRPLFWGPRARGVEGRTSFARSCPMCDLSSCTRARAVLHCSRASHPASRRSDRVCSQL